jgi:predicted DNA-binding transcriptional regulator AlpA
VSQLKTLRGRPGRGCRSKKETAKLADHHAAPLGLDSHTIYLPHYGIMLSTRQAAARLGLDPKTLSRYIAAKKVPAPRIMKVGSASLHGWTDEDIERVRALLPKIANGRKTRYSKPKKQTTRKPKH